MPDPSKTEMEPPTCSNAWLPENPAMDDNTTPPATDDAAMEASLLAQAKAFDAGTPVETPAAADAQPTPGPDHTQSGDAPAATPPKSTDTPPKQQDTPPAAPKPEAKPETPYQQKRSDAQRQADSWKKLAEEKEAFRKEREAFYREQATRAQPGRPDATPAPAAEDPLARYTPEQLEAAAKEFDANGQFDLAESAREAAKAKRATPPPQQQTQQPPAQQQPAAFAAAHAEWKANLAALEKENPELSDANSAFYKETLQALANYPMLRRYPGGIRDAVELVKTIRTAREAEGLRKERDTWKTRAETAEARLLPAGGAPESGLLPRDITEMGDAEAEAELKRMAAEADARAA